MASVSIHTYDYGRREQKPLTVTIKPHALHDGIARQISLVINATWQDEVTLFVTEAGLHQLVNALNVAYDEFSKEPI